MNEMKDLLNELTNAAIDGIFKNEKLTEAVTRYCKDIHSNLILKGFSSNEAFELTKILMNQGYMNSKRQ